MTVLTDLDDLLNGGHSAARVLDECGWAQGEIENAKGQVCAEGAALRACTIPGDGHLLRQVVIHRWNAGADFNDASERTAAEVRAALDRDVTEDDLAATFGPQWQAIIALVRRTAVLTPAEVRGLSVAWDAARDTARGAAWDAADAAGDAAGDAAWDAVRGAAWDAARDTARGAAWALVVRDLIGQRGFTADHYRTLTGPWANVIGPAHPDDERDGLL